MKTLSAAIKVASSGDKALLIPSTDDFSLSPLLVGSQIENSDVLSRIDSEKLK